MSVKAVSWYLDKSKQDGPRLLALLSLAEWSDDHGSCYPSMASIAQRLRRSERTAQAVIAELEEAGELLVVPGAGKKVQGGYLTRYYLLHYMDANNLPISEEHAEMAAERRQSDRAHGHQGMQKRTEGVQETSPLNTPDNDPESDEGVQEVTPLPATKRGAETCKGVQVLAEKGCRNLHPNRQLEPSVKTTLLPDGSTEQKPKGKGKAKSSEPPEAIEQRRKLLAAWLDVSKAKHYRPPKVNTGIMDLFRAEVSPEELIDCYQWMQGDKFWKGKTIFPQSIFDKIDEYRAETQRKVALNGHSSNGHVNAEIASLL